MKGYSIFFRSSKLEPYHQMQYNITTRRHLILGDLTSLQEIKLVRGGVMVKAMDGGIVVSEFVLQSCYYVQFRANTLGKGMNPLILPAMG